MASGTIKAVVSKSDIVDNLTTNDSTKVLSAAQGYSLNGKIASLVKSATVNGTTDSMGDLNINLATSDYIPIMYKITGGNMPKSAVITFLQNLAGTQWYVKFTADNNMTNIASTTVEGTIYYLEI